jgi:hypothetical protein
MPAAGDARSRLWLLKNAAQLQPGIAVPVVGNVADDEIARAIEFHGLSADAGTLSDVKRLMI